MIRDRLITVWEWSGLSAKVLEEKTGIDRSNWYSLKQGRRRANEDDISGMIQLYPQFALWLVTGQITPETGQTSPEYEDADKNLKEPGKG